MKNLLTDGKVLLNTNEGISMFAKIAFIAFFASTFVQFSFAQVEEKTVDYTISPSVLVEGKIHVAYEWLKPIEFNKRNLSVIDTANVSSLHPGNNHLVGSKLAFISKRSFDELSYGQMNNAKFISKMLNSVAIKQKTADTWAVTNKVKAYGFPISVNFDLKFNELSASAVPASVARYLKDEGDAMAGTTRERFLVLDMTNFSQLMYRNYSYVYIKEIGPRETMIVAGIVAGFDLKAANSYFNFPPFSSTRGTMMSNMREQIIQMAKAIQGTK